MRGILPERRGPVRYQLRNPLRLPGTRKTTLAELRDELGLQVHAILQIRELADWLVGRELDGKVVLDAAGKAAIDKHLEAYGGTD